MTAGGDDYISLLIPEHTLVFGLYDSCTDSGLLNIEKAKLFKCLTHGFYSNAVIVCNKRGRKAYYYGVAALKKNSCLLCAVNDLLCILGAHNEAMTAKNALVTYYMCLVSGKADRLYRTVTYTLIAVFAV